MMTREELQKLVDNNAWYNGMACGIGLGCILAHDAEQRAEIAYLTKRVEALRRFLCKKRSIHEPSSHGF